MARVSVEKDSGVQLRVLVCGGDGAGCVQGDHVGEGQVGEEKLVRTALLTILCLAKLRRSCAEH